MASLSPSHDTRSVYGGIAIAELANEIFRAIANGIAKNSSSQANGITITAHRAPGSQRRKARFMKRSEEHTSELQSLMCLSYAVFCLQKKKHKSTRTTKNKT